VTSYASVRPLLFRLEAERVHRRAVRFADLAGAALATAARAGLEIPPPTSPRLERRLLGLTFPNPIGLAAGFDKNAIAPHAWGWFGFGFAELGTVTGEAQSGNPPPRLFRLAEDRAIVNRLGFNNDGAERVAARLVRSLRARPRTPIGLNIGASRSRMGDPEAELADYRESARRLGRLADYLAINVSSPNTPGLRDLQAPDRLGRLVGEVRREVSLLGLGVSAPRVLVKLSPDLDAGAVGEICAAALEAGAAGFIATNTTLSREGCRSPQAGEAGGLSGEPLRPAADRMIARIRGVVGRDVPIIGVGGVARIEHVLDKLAAGADLVSLYTGLVYEGPFLPKRLARALDGEIERRGVGSVADLVGDGSTEAAELRATAR